MVLALTPIALATGCSGNPGSEQTVHRYFAAVSNGDSERMAETFVAEVAEGIKLAVLPRISIENLVIKTVSETEDTAEVTAEYDTDFPVPTHIKVRFILVKIDGDWLISAAEAAGLGNIARAKVLVYDEGQDLLETKDGTSPSRHVQICRADFMPRC